MADVRAIEVVAIIPARGGSQGIVSKNLRAVGGIPLVARSVRACSAAASVDLVVVSTDDAKIAEVARSEGATVVDRPPALASAAASSESAVLHTLDELLGAGNDPSIAVLVQCTSPFTRPEDIDGCIARLRASDAGCAFTVAPNHRFLWRVEGGQMIGVNHDHTAPRARRQDLEPEYLETGAVYAIDVKKLQATGRRFGGDAIGHVVDRADNLEIDEPVDLLIADALDAVVRPPSKGLPSQVDLVVLDFDGVMTDNSVIVDETGREAIRADRGDGMGIEMLQASGIPVVVLSREQNPVVAARCEKLKVAYEQSVLDKPPAFIELVERYGARLDCTIYVGNDVNDVGCLELAGCGVVVNDAHVSARVVADLVLARAGGHGAIRELADSILLRKGS